MKSDSLFKRSLNTVLELIRSGELGSPLPSETDLARRLAVSRTTVRKVIHALAERGLVVEADGVRRLGRPVAAGDFYPETETTPRPVLIEQQFMEVMLRGGVAPGTLISELELARQFGVATNGVREFLIRFSRFGLIEKRPGSGWLFKGFTADFAMELFEIRVMFELRSALLFARAPAGSPSWAALAVLKAEHHALLADVDGRYHDFPKLDDRFHRLIVGAQPNRFIDDFYDVISFIFHYHYQWNKRDEKARNRAAAIEHLAYIEALESGEWRRIRRACERHMVSARDTLKRSLMEVDRPT